jgi:hypothetical protein
MIRIALNFGSSTVLYRNQNAAGVGTIVWARGMDDTFPHGTIIKCFFQVRRRSKKSKTGGFGAARLQFTNLADYCA